MTLPHDHYETLLMKRLDGVLSDSETAELEAHLSECAPCREELRDFTAIKGATDALRDRISRDARIEPYRPAGWARLLLSTGFMAVTLALVLLTGFGTAVLLTDPEVPRLVRAAVGLLAAGSLLLFGYALRARLRARRNDPYERIDL